MWGVDQQPQQIEIQYIGVLPGARNNPEPVKQKFRRQTFKSRSDTKRGQKLFVGTAWNGLREQIWLGYQVEAKSSIASKSFGEKVQLQEYEIAQSTERRQ